MKNIPADIPGILGRLPLFQELGPEQIIAVAAGVREKRLTRGEMLFQGLPLGRVFTRAAVAVGVAGLFIETHQDPDKAPSDGPNMVPLVARVSVFHSMHSSFFGS